MELSHAFYTRNDVLDIARDLLGKVLCSSFDGIVTSGIITETEAYAGVTDKASHAYNGRRTQRTEIMFWDGGTAYVYLCYGMHSLFNVVTSLQGIPHAVLVRAIKPLEGIDVMKERTGKKAIGDKEGIGPGKVSKLLGIHFSHSGWSLVEPENQLYGDRIWIEDRMIRVDPSEIVSGPRIGVDYAGEDALLPYRFRIF
ncbi:MAG: DNA-3-methyladenine glycosylase [Bacteroidetes bacterium]|nr:DNA-3-methyladenine glycosylase [Bacteroidota bacterium]